MANRGFNGSRQQDGMTAEGKGRRLVMNLAAIPNTGAGGLIIIQNNPGILIPAVLAATNPPMMAIIPGHWHLTTLKNAAKPR